MPRPASAAAPDQNDLATPNVLADQFEALERTAEDLVGVGLQPAVQDAGVDAAEVGGPFQVAAIQPVGLEAGMPAVDAGSDLAADDEERGGGDVVGPAG